MYLTCKRTKEILILTDGEVELIDALVRRLDLEDVFRVFDNRELKSSTCKAVSTLIKTHIEENKIFEQDIGEMTILIVLDDNVNIPPGIKPISMRVLATISRYSTFLSKALFGVIVSDGKY